MRSFLRVALAQTTFAGCFALAACVAGCGTDTTGTGPAPDTAAVDETGADTTRPDTEVPDTGSEDSTTTETSLEDATDSGDSSTDSDATTPDVVDDSDAADVETGMVCMPGKLCSDNNICMGGTCLPCASDAECRAAEPTTLCYGGKCLPGTCKPKPATTSGCMPTGSTCCATSTSSGTCFAPVTGKTSCCENADCASVSGGLTKCDPTTRTCTCPDPTPGTWYVSPGGSDTMGNGSVSCPFKTINTALGKTVGATTATTIVLQKLPTGVTTYGVGCTGAGLCDTTPILIPNTVTAGLTIKGDGTASDVVVTGPGDSIFGVTVQNISFEALTLRPTKTGLSNTGGHGIVYDYATGAAPGSVKGVVVSGPVATGTTTGAGSGIIVKGGAQVTIGPSVELTGGFHGLLVEGNGRATVVGAPMAQTMVSGNGGACIYVNGTAGGSDPSIAISSTGMTNDVAVRNCGASGAIVIDKALAGTTSTLAGFAVSRTGGGAYPGVSLLKNSTVTISRGSITGLVGNGIIATNNARLTTTGVAISANGDTGLLLSGNATADLSGVSSRNNFGPASDGIRCESLGGVAGITMKLRNSSTLSNGANGLRVMPGCAVDLGAVSDPGNNSFNTASQLNVQSGVCIDSLAANVTVTLSKWKCLTPPISGCAPGAPLTASSPGGGPFRCQNGVDITESGGKITAPPPQECCAAVL